MIDDIKGAEILICGGGIIGLTLCRELVKQGYKNIVVIEKERTLGLHASGRNSGVLHAGIYYPHDSLKARTCLRGNLLMKEYCQEKKIPLIRSGKVVVSKNEAENVLLKELYHRAEKNGARVELIDEKMLMRIEPQAKTNGIALLSHDTAIVEPLSILKNIHDDLISSGYVKILFETAFKGIKGNNRIYTNRGDICFDLFVNCAGAYSDKVAHLFSVGKGYKLIPFKGFYKKLRQDKSSMINGNIYPVPDIDNPFLGVHFTRDINGDVHVGPTAVPALGRENYGIIRGLSLDSFGFIAMEGLLFLKSRKFRRTVISEIGKYSAEKFYHDTQALVKDIDKADLLPSSKVGIRPQLVDISKRELLMDYMIIKDINSVHILNAVSPAFTGSMEFARLVVRNYINA